MIYTDVTQLPTFDAVASVPWHEEVDQGGNFGESSSPTASLLPEFRGLSLSQNDINYEQIAIPESVVVQLLSPYLTQPDRAGQMVLRAGVEPAHLSALPPEDSVSANSTT